MAKASDSRIRFEKGDDGEDRVVIRPNRWGLLFVVPLGVMLTFWARDLVSVLGGPLVSGEPLSVRLFVVFWLLVWLAFGYILVAVALGVLFLALGTEEIRISAEHVTRTQAVLGFRRTRRFATPCVSSIVLAPPRRRGRSKTRTVQMEAEGRRLRIATAVVGEEAEFLAAELHRLLQEHQARPPEQSGARDGGD